jgi:chromosome segregation ATPase
MSDAIEELISDIERKFSKILSDVCGQLIAFRVMEDAYRERAVKAEAERDRLREALIATGRHLGAGLSEEVSSDFLTLIPEEARLLKAEIDRLREALAAAETRLFHCSNAVELLRGVEAENDRLREALERIVREWEAAPDPLYRELRECWLAETMEPAIDAARAALAKEAGR